MNVQKEHYKLVVCVFACATIPEYKNEILKIEETWGNRAKKINVKVLYFLGEEQTDLNDDTKYIYLKNVKNDYSSAADKQNFGFKHIYENYNADFIYCCGTDTYINVDNMLSYINNFDCNKPLYIGGHGDTRIINKKPYYFHCGGAGFIISKSALKEIYPKLDNIKPEWIQICFDSKCEDLVPACDVAISYYLQNIIGSELEIVENKKVFFGCNYKGIVHHKNVGLLFMCCNNVIDWQTLISCHCMNGTDFDVFTKILEDNKYFQFTES
jgi:hypothetical protein